MSLTFFNLRRRLAEERLQKEKEEATSKTQAKKAVKSKKDVANK